jgi:hypothetical protein
MTRIYFAHSKLDYGTPVEDWTRRFISRQFADADVLCPHRDIGEATAVGAYNKLVSWASVVVVLEHRNTVGRGVYQEITTALAHKIPVFAVRRRKLVPIVGIKVMDEESWADGYGVLLAVRWNEELRV